MCWFGVLLMYRAGVLQACTGLVCCMYWTGVLHVLDWCVVCTGLVCSMYWTGLYECECVHVYECMCVCVCDLWILFCMDMIL